MPEQHWEVGQQMERRAWLKPQAWEQAWNVWAAVISGTMLEGRHDEDSPGAASGHRKSTRELHLSLKQITLWMAPEMRIRFSYTLRLVCRRQATKVKCKHDSVRTEGHSWGWLMEAGETWKEWTYVCVQKGEQRTENECGIFSQLM